MSGGKGPKNKGDQYERDVVAYLKSKGLHVERCKRGNATGDILGVADIVIECKNQKEIRLASWLDQTLGEVEEAEARHGVMFVKRRGRSDVARHYFVMEAEDGLQLLAEAGYLGF